ncbi:hypothetical protein DICVIV_05251 [Dictyocaulus viviparus]|uniref:Uncharacterized protein n=1 Tax=Dictyocaulus viviparus TaxID=29172 RepID=A0A0D8XVF4_DICVI|nr:hypothetical protein DICVIV_05251 [Dictyocaulus viviparus]
MRTQTHALIFFSEESGVRRRARTVDPSSRENMPYSTSSFYATSPVTSHTVRRTPATSDRSANFAYDRGGVVQGSVKGFVNQWPPASNATGANVMKDDWVREILKDNEDELVTTMCRRIVERKIEDKWRWLDEHGRVLDEKNQKTWKVGYSELERVQVSSEKKWSFNFHGELDTVLRDGPGEAKHWSRTVECLPTGEYRNRNYNYRIENTIEI